MMPTAAVARGLLLTVGLVTTVGAVIGATRALLEDRRNTRDVRARLSILFPQE